MTTVSAIEEMIRDGSLDLPLPGHGRTSERHLRLFEIARRHPVSVARLVEAHTDAVAILAEATREPVPGAVYGVWASSDPNAGLELHREAGKDDSVVVGSMPFASGLGVVTRALVSATEPANPDRAVLLDLDVRPGDTLAFVEDWSTPALADAHTGSVAFHDHRVGSIDVVGPPGWYLDRVGFWHGACGPAACWAGAAAGLIDAAERLVDDNPHRRAHLGAMRSHLWTLEGVLVHAGDGIDRQPSDIRAAERRARALRHAVERTVADVLDRFGRAFGPRPFAHDPELNQRWLDAHLYTRQDHAERDLDALGRLDRDHPNHA